MAWYGDDLELSAEAIEELAQQTMTPQDFVTFMQRHNLTEEAVASYLATAGARLVISKRSAQSRAYALACDGYQWSKLMKQAVEKVFAGAGAARLPLATPSSTEFAESIVEQFQKQTTATPIPADASLRTAA